MYLIVVITVCGGGRRGRADEAGAACGAACTMYVGYRGVRVHAGQSRALLERPPAALKGVLSHIMISTVLPHVGPLSMCKASKQTGRLEQKQHRVAVCVSLPSSLIVVCVLLQWVNNLVPFKVACEEIYTKEKMYKRQKTPMQIKLMYDNFQGGHSKQNKQ